MSDSSKLSGLYFVAGVLLFLVFREQVLAESRGGNVNNKRALVVGLRMIKGLCFGWRKGSS